MQKLTTLVTCSYAPDAKRCEFLCSSIDKFIPEETPHLILVPKKDLSLFRHMENKRRTVISAESILPRFMYQLPGQDKWWVSAFSIPIRGWIVQQLTKLCSSKAVNTENIMFVDSDTIFIKPFDPDSTVSDGKSRLFLIRTQGKNQTAINKRIKWHRQSEKLLGLPQNDELLSGYVSQLITWNVKSMEALKDRIKSAYKLPWYIPICNSLRFSEYTLYGVFVEHFKEQMKKHYIDETNLCFCLWKTPNKKLSIKNLEKEIENHHVAILIQSTFNIAPESYIEDINRLTNSAG